SDARLEHAPGDVPVDSLRRAREGASRDHERSLMGARARGRASLVIFAALGRVALSLAFSLVTFSSGRAQAQPATGGTSARARTLDVTVIGGDEDAGLLMDTIRGIVGR